MHGHAHSVRRHGAAAALALILSAGLAAAEAEDPFAQSVQAALAEQGFVVVELGHTWLGRLRVVAESGELRRELVFDPGTGEILRDIVFRMATAAPGPAPRRDGSPQGGAAAVARAGDGAGPVGPASDAEAIELPGLSVTEVAPPDGPGLIGGEGGAGSFLLPPPLVLPGEP